MRSLRAVTGVAVLAILLSTPALEAGAAHHEKGGVMTAESQSAMTPVQALEKLKAGNERWAKGSPMRRDVLTEVKATAKGQYPYAVILACQDSRTSTEQMFDLGVGDAFTLRIAGNIANDDNLGGVEFGTKLAGAKLIAVIGHTSCGAVKGACDGAQLGHLTGLLEQIGPAVESASPGAGERSSKNAAFVEAVAKENVMLQMRRIREGSPVVRELIDSGAVGLVGGMYDLGTGRVEWYAD